MAVRFDASADCLTRSAGVPTFGDLTCMLWVYRVSTPANYQLVWVLGSSAAFATYAAMYCDAANGAFWLDVNMNGTGAAASGPARSTGVWYHAAVVHTPGTDTMTLYVNGVQEVLINPGDTATPWGYEALGNYDTTSGSRLDGRVAAYKAWTAALSVSEIQQEMWQYLPLRLSNLHSWTPLLTHTVLAEMNKGTDWTANGTLTTEIGPPIPWSLAVPRVQIGVGVAARKAPPPFLRTWRIWKRAS